MRSLLVARSVARSRLLSIALGPLLIVSAAFAAGPAEGPWVTPQVLAPGARLPGLRVFAEAGDIVLENDAVTAVIRKSDGALVDFKRKGTPIPTSAQLLTTSDIDGLWDLVPVALGPDGERVLPEAARIALRKDAVEVTSVLSRRKYVVGARVRYALDATKPRLRIHASFHAEAQRSAALDVGLSVRWGNVTYFVDGHSEPLTQFGGFVRWAGRAGAGGDLLLRAVAPPVYMAQFVSREHGFQGPLNAVAIRPTNTARSVVAVYELSYEPLPTTAAPAHPPGRLEIDVKDEQNRPLASKVMLLPNGQMTAVFPDDGGIDGADQFAWSGNGHIVCEPPPGRYELRVSAGPERALTRHHVVIEPFTTSRVTTTLPRVVSTPGWVSADLHLHQAPSVDADISLESRVIAVAAEGVELAVATDHYVVTDLAPTVQGLLDTGALARPLLTLPGTEASTVGHRFGHFNVFPMPLDQNVEYRDTTPSRLFASARKASPDGVLQVNHPRWTPSLGYFTRFDVDPVTGTARKPGFDPHFDALEVYNGDDARQVSKVEKVLGDYMRLLGTGRRYVATGNSDSHKLAFLDPGIPRTLIASGGSDDDADARAPIADILAALKSGRAIVTSGPVIDASVGTAGPGQTATGVGRRAELKVRVRAAPWVSVSRLRVLEGPSGSVAHQLEIPKSDAPTRFERTLAISIERPTFVVVTVAGDDPLPNSSRGDILPFAFTNPIWLEP